MLGHVQRRGEEGRVGVPMRLTRQVYDRYGSLTNGCVCTDGVINWGNGPIRHDSASPQHGLSRVSRLL